jgi:tRNA (cmo5U34)-methyltransferase
MAVNTETGKHIPKNSMLFEFDDEVISVFDNMASRSIVGYERAYELLTYLFNRVNLPRGSQVWDMGTTTGRGLRAVREGRMLDPYLDYFATDISQPSIEETSKRLPWATAVQHDFRDGLPEKMEDGKASVIIWGYTLQFLEDPHLRADLIHQCKEKLCSGGILVVLEKYVLRNELMNGLMQDAYIQFRRQNGYSHEEIELKTAALKNAMWPESPEFMRDCMGRAGFQEIHTLYRELNFGGMVAFKG